jgi:hypothetical protein
MNPEELEKRVPQSATPAADLTTLRAMTAAREPAQRGR